MKKLLIIIAVLAAAGCVSNKNESISIEKKKITGCPENVKLTGQYLIETGVDKEKVDEWVETTIAKEIHPCSICNKLNNAAIILKDDRGIYKTAMKSMITTARKVDPNSSLDFDKQVQILNKSKITQNEDEVYSLAAQYLDALENMETFLVNQLIMTPEEAQNFMLDHYFIPLYEETQKK